MLSILWGPENLRLSTATNYLCQCGRQLAADTVLSEREITGSEGGRKEGEELWLILGCKRPIYREGSSLDEREDWGRGQRERGRDRETQRETDRDKDRQIGTQTDRQR